MANPLTPREARLRLQVRRRPQIAPDGARILYTLAQLITRRRSQQPALAVRPRRRQRAPADAQRRRNGGGAGRPTAQRSPSSPTAARRAGIFVLPLDGRRRSARGDAPRQGIGDLAWSPDGTPHRLHQHFDPANPDEEAPPEGARPEGARHAAPRLQAGQPRLARRRAHQVFVVDVASGERRVSAPSRSTTASRSWSPDGASAGQQRRPRQRHARAAAA